MLSWTEKPISPDKPLISKHINKPKKLHNAEVSDEPITSFSLFAIGIFPLKSNQVFPVLHAPEAQILWRLNYSFTLPIPFGASQCKLNLTYVISKLKALQQQLQQQLGPCTAILHI